MSLEERAMLFTLRNTLNLINVHGQDDMSRLLGCINALDNLLREVNENGNLHAEQ